LTRITAFTAALGLLLGCGSSPQEKVQLARRTVRSWTATVEKTTDAVERRAAPRLYGRQIVIAAVESRKQEAGSPEWRMVPAEERAALDRAIQRLQSLLGPPQAGHL
jgi:hypothetical protein